MKKAFTKLCLMMLLTVTSLASMAQFTASGTVSDASNNPLSGVSVKVKSSNTGTTTDGAGKFSINLPGIKGVLEFSYVGYQSQSVSVSSSSGSISIKMIDASNSLNEIVLTGTRSLPRSSASTPLPTDNLDLATLKSTGQTTFDKTLQYRVPSFNTVNTPVNDASTLLDPYEIRNLGPSRTLVLINGKRKNLSSLLYVQFSPGRGETGADLSGIPLDAIKSVEILRDGASAQYGSDAIAGVMNVILKDKYQYSSLTLNGGDTSKGDGGSYGYH